MRCFTKNLSFTIQGQMDKLKYDSNRMFDGFSSKVIFRIGECQSDGGINIDIRIIVGFFQTYR